MAVAVSTSGSTRHLRLDRPEKRNALTLAMYADLADALREADADEAITAVLIAGEGKGFCAGNDLADFLAEPPTGEDSPVFRFLRALVEVRVPLIAAVHGNAVGIGATMLLHCDIAVADATAVLSYPFTALGVVPEAGSSMLLPRVNAKLAARLLLAAEPIGAEAALAAGLLTSVVPAGEHVAAAIAFADRLAELPRDAVRDTRGLLHAPAEPLPDRIAREAELFIRRLASPDFQTQARRFLG